MWPSFSSIFPYSCPSTTSACQTPSSTRPTSTQIPQMPVRLTHPAVSAQLRLSPCHPATQQPATSAQPLPICQTVSSVESGDLESLVMTDEIIDFLESDFDTLPTCFSPRSTPSQQCLPGFNFLNSTRVSGNVTININMPSGTA